ncbi:UDP-N-acetylmuramoyl-tripeptide--D-alanyl-D-alanine ligase [Numidum massiliense]|uniref:UDP-N-acetylmuramoyl-tripeptide--D-alanyl-D- alanine ligase n=1 Tax=Numidum massiliense TaxID=1522315 RepID=UPI000AD1AABB|nr:UDP-N-acetylmuramoyl-tripeptide--D-alanyl-D-alanine ligase [Numidum massiliense]
MIRRTFTQIAHMVGGIGRHVDESERHIDESGRHVDEGECLAGEEGPQAGGSGRHDGVRDSEQVLEVHGVSIDTRTIQPGNLFIPIVGERFNGHAFVRQALASGAVAALWNKREPEPPPNVPLIFVDDTTAALQRLAQAYRQQLGVKVIGITGSNGKTSTKDILAALLATTYNTQKTRGNLNNHFGVPLTLLALAEHTEVAVVEMGMSGLGEIEQLTSLARPDVAVITNVGECHLSDLGSRERIAQAKMEILTGLSEDGLFVYNGDDARLIQHVQRVRRSGMLPYQTVTFGQSSFNSFYPQRFTWTESGISFTLAHANCPPLFLPLLGQHQLMNGICAITVAAHLGVPYTRMVQGLLQVEASHMRNELTRVGNVTIMNDTYKSNPTSLRAALDTMYGLKKYQKKIAVLGDMLDMGDEAVRLHQEIGSQIDLEQIDALLTIGPLAAHIAAAAKQRAPGRQIMAFTTKEDLISALKEVAEDGCLILVKGSRDLRLEEVVAALAP